MFLTSSSRLGPRQLAYVIAELVCLLRVCAACVCVRVRLWFYEYPALLLPMSSLMSGNFPKNKKNKQYSVP